VPAAALSATGRRARVLAFATGLALLVAGTAWGQDDHFPFGPFRMYSTADDPDGRVLSTYLEAVDEDGAVLTRVGEREIGLRRAEYEGQLSRVVDEPAVLAQLAEVFRRRHPDRPAWVEVRVVQTAHVLLDGQPTDEQRTVLATWRRP
jgi:hypothetical protein